MKIWVFALTLFALVSLSVSMWEDSPARRYREEVTRRIIALGHPQSDLYHLLPGERCQLGYLRMPHAFSRAGETWDACWSGKRGPTDFTLDFLLPDEDAAIGAVVKERR